MEARKTGKPTLSDVAAASGVSVATVSYVLGGKQGGCAISETTARRILEAAAALDYRRNEAAAALAALRSAPLSLLVLSPWLYSQFSDFMFRVNGVLAALPATVQYLNYHPGALGEVLTPRLAKRFHGVLVMGTHPRDEAFLRRSRGKFPTLVLLNRQVEGVLSIHGNDREATAELCQQVASREYYEKQIFLHSPQPGYCETARMSGFLSVFPKGQVLEMPKDPGALLSLAEQRRTFFFGAQYHLGAKVLTEAVRAGVPVPETWGIAVYDVHSLIADFLPKKLSAIQPHTEEMVRQAVAAVEALRRGEVPEDRLIAGDLLPGDTLVL